ncbi:YHYH domain-containing protein [Sporosarcina luteola]|uniref:YHYH domain-containing protein n=1 Tax=Sporosarcina luteola TaxID=582850 RepID=UPI00203D47C9|nr:YHYH domain-containing protein [Sporosarcina luteola]MCM3745102.1 YHYH domain-containing protein [Sporosarcina luteola]
MKKLFVKLSIVLFTLSLFENVALAHPGRTDGNGGHTCRTNCAKWGLKTGEYHYHNGGGSSSSSGTTYSKPKPKPQPTYSQADVDYGKNSGESQGYEDGYNRRYKNASTDMGNEGYKKGYASGYAAGYQEGLEKIKEEDIQSGATLGEKDGKSALRKGENKEVSMNDSKSDDWNSAYKVAFIKAYDYEKNVQNAEQSGHNLGYTLAELVLPTEFDKDTTFKKAFESHYKTGYKKRIEEEEKKHFELGRKDGYALSLLAITSMDNRFLNSYEQGYEEGKSRRKEEVIAEGHQSAFVNFYYPETDEYDNQELIDWFKEGYDSNEIAVQVKDSAFDNGYANSQYVIPEEFKVNGASIALYDSLFKEGQEVRTREKKENMKTATGVSLTAGGIAMGGYLLRKRKKKKLI